MQRRKLDSRLADYALALDLVSRMAELTAEDLAIERILDLFVEICAPSSLAYVPFYNGRPGAPRCRQEGVVDCDEIAGRLSSLEDEWAWTDSGRGFMLRVHRGGEPLGALEVEGIAFPEHKEHYLNLALAIQGVLGLAISNARNYESLEGARRDLQEERDALRSYLDLSEALNRINATVGSTLEFDEIIRRVMGEAAAALGADSGALMERCEGGWLVEYAYGKGRGTAGVVLPDAQLPVTVQAARERTTVVCNDLTDLVPQLPEAIKDARSVVNVPLMVKDELVGVLSFRSTRLDAFSEALVDFASKIGATVSLALENARLFEAKRSVADTLQRALIEMPENVPGVRFGYSYQAATAGEVDVGGDFYDVFPLSGGRVAVLVGDVSGSGILAAKTTTLVKDTIQAFAQLPESPASVLARTNEVVFQRSSSEVFATVFFGVLDPGSGTLVYCSAGHPPGLLRHAAGGVTELPATSPLLGALSGGVFADAVTTVSAEDVLVLYTDGAIEARRDREFFGEDRLQRAVAEGPGEPERAAGNVLAAVEEFTRGVLTDDLAVLCVKRAAGER